MKNRFELCFDCNDHQKSCCIQPNADVSSLVVMQISFMIFIFKVNKFNRKFKVAGCEKCFNVHSIVYINEFVYF